MQFPELLEQTYSIEKEFSVYALAEIAGIGGGHAIEAILSPFTQTGKALRSLGITGYELAGSITGAPGNYLCDARFDGFSRAIQSIFSHQVIDSKQDHWKKTHVLEGFAAPHPLHQLFDFMTGRNIDVLVEVGNSLSVADIYTTITENLSLDLDQSSSIHISHILHAGRLEMIRITDLNDLNNQGINIIIKTKDDTWNKQSSARIKEVTPVQYRADGTPYIKTHVGIWHEPNELLVTPSSFAEWHTIFVQELRRTAMQPDRGMNIDSFAGQLAQIYSDEIEYSHEQVCLITANLARAFDRFPDKIYKILSAIPILHDKFALNTNTPEKVEAAIQEYALQLFGEYIEISPHIIYLLSISLPIDIDVFMKMSPTKHSVLSST